MTEDTIEVQVKELLSEESIRHYWDLIEEFINQAGILIDGFEMPIIVGYLLTSDEFRRVNIISSKSGVYKTDIEEYGHSIPESSIGEGEAFLNCGINIKTDEIVYRLHFRDDRKDLECSLIHELLHIVERGFDLTCGSLAEPFEMIIKFGDCKELRRKFGNKAVDIAICISKNSSKNSGKHLLPKV